MNILILCDHFGTGGGAGTIARFQAEELSKHHNVHVLTAHLPNDKRQTTNIVRVTGFDFDYPLKFRNYLGLYHPKAIQVLKNYFSNNQFDLAITHNIFYNWSYSSLDVLAKHKIKTIHVFHDVSSFTNNTKLCGIQYRQITNDPLTSFAHNRQQTTNDSGRQSSNYAFNYHYSEFHRIREWWGGIYNPLRQSKIRKHLLKTTKTVAVSDALANALRQNNIRVDAVVHNGLRQKTTNDKRQTTNSILMMGRMNTAKGFLQAVEYLAYLKHKHNLTPELRIAGNQDVSMDLAAQKVVQKAKALGVDSQITFLGWLDKDAYANELASCGLLIVPSVCFDSFPTVALEAMQYTKPVIATIFGGAKEIVQHGETGYIENPFDIPAFSERIRKLLTDQEKNRNFGKAGLRRLQNAFSLEKQTHLLLDVLN